MLPVRKGSRQQKDGRLPADLLRSLRPSIRHYRPEMLLADALKRELDLQVVRAKSVSSIIETPLPNRAVTVVRKGPPAGSIGT